jgi:hypothetical protein
MSDKDAEIKISADSAQAEAAFSRVGLAGKKAAYELSESFEKIHSKMERVNKQFEKMAGLFALGFAAEKIVEGARHFAEYADEIEKSGQKSGIAADKLQGLQFAAKMSDVSAKDLDNSLKKLAKAMEGAGAAGNKGAEAFAAVGIKASDLKHMKTEDVLAKVADAFANSKDGAGKAAIAMELFGKSGIDMIPFLNKGSGSIKELVAQAKKMGLVLSGEALESAAKLDDQFKLMDAQMAGLQRRTSSALVPAFLQITNTFSQSTQEGGALAGAFDRVGEVLLVLTSAASYATQSMYAIGITIGATTAAVVAAVHGDFTAAKQIMDMVDKDIEASTKKFEAFRATLEKPVNTPGAAKKEASGGEKNELHLDGGGKPKSQVSEWKAELEARKEVEGNFFKNSADEEEAFWNTRLQQVRKGSKDEIAVRHELFAIHKQQAVQKFAVDQDTLKAEIAAAHAGGAERIALATEAARRVGETYGWESTEYVAAIKDIKKAAEEFDKEQKKLEGMKIDRAREHNVALIDMERDQLSLRKSLGQVSDQEEIAQLKSLREREYQIEVLAQQDKIAVMKEEGPARQQQLDELLKMKDRHAADMAKLDIQSAQIVKKNWTDMLSSVNNALEQSINGMIMGTQTLQKAMANIGQAILAEFVKMGVKKLTVTMANNAAELFSAKAKDSAVSASAAGGTLTTISSKATEATAVVTGNAAEAASGAAASVSTIPWVGPVMAVAAFAAIMALVLGAKGMIKSSAGGEWQVPSDRLNFVHKDETILPAHIAGPLRDMVSGGGSMGGGLPPITIHAMDSRDVERALKSGGALHKALTGLNRNFATIR